MTEFFHMGGHGVFIWISYGIAFTTLGLLGAFSYFKQRNSEREITDLKNAQNRSRQNSKNNPASSGNT
jgi:heme exporter protein D